MPVQAGRSVAAVGKGSARAVAGRGIWRTRGGVLQSGIGVLSGWVCEADAVEIA